MAVTAVVLLNVRTSVLAVQVVLVPRSKSPEIVHCEDEGSIVIVPVLYVVVLADPTVTVDEPKLPLKVEPALAAPKEKEPDTVNALFTVL